MKSIKCFALAILPIFLIFSCGENPKKKSRPEPGVASAKDSVPLDTTATHGEEEEERFVLTEENAIDFFFDYQKDLKVDKVKITTRFGSFTIQLYDNVPYHKANFIYLTRKGYFDSTQFHRVVRNFIIQGGSSDDKKTAQKRKEIGRYLLPPDTRKGHKHHRGTISMPSSEIDQSPHAGLSL